MRFIATLFSVASLAIASTLADIVIPEGYWIEEVYPTPHPPKMAGDLPNGPLLNATWECGKKYWGVLYSYELTGYRWDNVPEKQIKSACNAGNAAMTGWKFKSWDREACGFDWKGRKYCTGNYTEWHATFHMSMVAGHELAMTDEFHRLTGAYGDVNHIKERAAWVMTNGSHKLEGNMWQSYPPGGHHFRCFWV